MTTRNPTNLPASIRARLLNKARQDSSPNFNDLLRRYAMERLLARIAATNRSTFVLKGGIIMGIWTGEHTRSTTDIDLLSRVKSDPAEIEEFFRRACEAEVEPDGMRYDAGAVRSKPITIEKKYPGVRIRLLGYLGNAREHLQVDIAFGDIVSPGPELIRIPTILDGSPPELEGYTRESQIAEKLEAMIKIGALNGRMKDFDDLATLGRIASFDRPRLVEAIRATFENRGTPVSGSLGERILSLGAEDHMTKAWAAYSRRQAKSGRTLGTFERTLKEIVRFLEMPYRAAGGDEKTKGRRWPAGGPWE